MINDDVPARLEPHAAPERLLDVLLDAQRLEDRRGLFPAPHPVAERRHQGLDVAGTLVVDLARVDDELVDLRREQIAYHPEGEIALFVQDRRRRRLLEARLDLSPQTREEFDVGGKLALALALGVGSQDEAARRQAHRAQRGAQALALAVVTDAARDADVTGLRHVDEITPRKRDERGDPGALGPEGFLRDLHQNGLVFVDEVFDRRHLAAGHHLAHDVGIGIGVGLVALAFVVGDGQHHAGQVGQIGRVVAGVEEGVLLQADVDERRLHARQDVRHDTLVDAPHDRAVPMPLEVQLGEEITLLDSDSGFGETRIDDDPFAHGSTSPTR